MANRICVEKRGAEHGFSLIEVVVVALIVVTVAAIALPNLILAMYNVRLRSSAHTIAGMMQVCRTQAVRDNTHYFLRSAAVGETTIVWVSSSPSSSTPVSGEPQAQLGGNVRIVTSGHPGSPALEFTPITSQPPAFNGRGLPCVVSGGRCVTTLTSSGGVTTSAGFQLYLTDSRPFGADGWASVTINPSGRVQTFAYDGTNWED